MKKRTASALPFILSLCLCVSALNGQEHRFGWKPDQGGIVDRQFSAHRSYRATPIKPKTSLVPNTPWIYDQGPLGSCVGNGVACCLDYAHRLRTGRFVTPSRLFIYYNGRVLEGTTDEDSGLQIRDGIEAVFKWGACGENTKDGWAYDVRRFTEKPPAKAYRAALKRQALKGYKLDNTDGRSIRIALSADFPVVFGGYVYAGIETLDSSNYILPMPRGPPIGAHCMVIVGSDDGMRANGLTGFYLVRNSWGTRWGCAGYCWIPYAYIHNGRWCEDFWVIESAE